MAWWRGRALRRLLDDPALPERLLAADRANGAMLGAVLVLLGAVSVHALPWTLTLLLYSATIAAYPLRKAVFGETWSVGTYVWFLTRLYLAIWGFWIALLLMPMLAAAAGSFDWLVAAGMAALLVLWNARYADAVLWLLRARPIEDGALISRFRAMVQTSGIAMPRFECVDLHGGALANALALASLNRSSVIFTEPLLKRLQSDETVAICAHELAHLEHFNPRYLQRIRRVNLLLIGSGALVAPLARLAGAGSVLVPMLPWMAAFAGVMVWRARDRQRNETASDLRALALCGDSEALIRGLARLYAMARLPRRLDAHYEQQATHPSLARRIRDIRAAAGTPAPSLDVAASFRSADGCSAVTFADDTLQWREEQGAVHTLSYACLAELHVHVRAGGREASLVVTEQSGRRREMPLAEEDLARAQAVLDVVDARLPAPIAPASVWPKIGKVLLAFGAVIGLVLGQVAMAVVTILALLQPAAPLLAAAGIASLTAAALLLRHGLWGMTVAISLLLAAFGAALLCVARVRRDEKRPRRAGLAAGFLGLLAAVSVAALAIGGFDPVRIHQSARSATAAPVLLLAFAAALSLWRSRPAQYAAIPVIIVAAATSVAASTAFLDRFGRDPFLVPSDALVWKTVTGDPMAEFSVPFSASALVLSPSGRHVALMAEGDESKRGEPEPSTFHVGRPGGALAPVAADDVMFVDDDHILLLRSQGDGVELRRLRVDALDDVLWRVHVADMRAAELSYNGAAGQWRLMGWDRRRRIVRAEGLLGDSAVRRTDWQASDADDRWIESIAASGNDAIFVEARYDGGYPQRCGRCRWTRLFQPDSETRFRTVATRAAAEFAVSRFGARCVGAALGNDALVCGAFDGSRTRFIAIDPVSKRIAGVAWMDGRFVALHSARSGWLAGWHEGDAVALNLERRHAIRIEADGGGGPVFQIAASDRLVGTLLYNGDGSTVRLYVPPIP